MLRGDRLVTRARKVCQFISENIFIMISIPIANVRRRQSHFLLGKRDVGGRAVMDISSIIEWDAAATPEGM